MIQLKHRVAVYGSLLKGLSNHVVIGRYIPDGRAKLLGEDITDPEFAMLNLGAFPGLLEGENRISVEVYNLTEEAFRSVRRLEGYNPNGGGLYTEKTIETAYGPAVIYMFNRGTGSFGRSKTVEPDENGIVYWKNEIAQKSY